MSGEAEKTERAYVYMVRCAGGQLYTGWTNDPASRLHAHKSGKGAKCTRALGAQRFAYLERCTDKSAALRREAALKKLTKRRRRPCAPNGLRRTCPALAGHPGRCGGDPGHLQLVCPAPYRHLSGDALFPAGV